MQFAYKLTYKNGAQGWSVQNYLFTDEQMLNAFKEHGVVKVEYHRSIPNGCHLCACGNIVSGTDKHLLCDECREIYGHTFDYEL